MNKLWLLYDEIKENLSQITKIEVVDIVHTDGTGIVHFYEENPQVVSPINTASAIYFSRQFPGILNVDKPLPFSEWMENLIIPEINKHSNLLSIANPVKTEFNAYYLSQLLPSIEIDVAKDSADKLEKWFEAYIHNWIVNEGRYPLRLFVVYLILKALPYLRQSYRPLIERVSLFFLQKHIACGSCGIWSEFDPIDLAFAIFLARPTRAFTQLIPHASSLLNSAAKDGKIWQNQQYLMSVGSAIGCSAFHGCIALLDPSSELDIASKVGPSIEAHFQWIKEHRLQDKPWHFSDLHLRDAVIEPWFNFLVAEFLVLFKDSLHFKLQENLQQKYSSRNVISIIDWHRDVLLDNDVKKAINEKVIEPIQSNQDSTKPPTIIFFGPPGTAKTTIAEVLSKEIKWPFIEIGVADFLSKGLDQIFSQASDIFNELLKLQNVVVLLDEVEQIFAERGDEQRDLRQQFLTSALLPPLKKIHDYGRILLIIATNYIDVFDGAISRPGRIDLIIPIGPPNRANKIKLMQNSLSFPNELANGVADFLPPQATIGEILALKNLSNFVDESTEHLVDDLKKLWKNRFPKLQIDDSSFEGFNSQKEEYKRI